MIPVKSILTAPGALLIALLVRAQYAIRSTFNRCLTAVSGQSRERAVFANVGEGDYTHGKKSYLVDNSAASRYLLYKQGSDADHVDICTSSDIPLGSSDDQADADSPGLAIAVKLFGAAKGTHLVVTDGSLANGDLVVAADSGKVRKLPAGSGTYYLVGRALISSDMTRANGDVITLIPSFPTQRVI